jgi:hypothetical protein
MFEKRNAMALEGHEAAAGEDADQMDVRTRMPRSKSLVAFYFSRRIPEVWTFWEQVDEGSKEALRPSYEFERTAAQVWRTPDKLSSSLDQFLLAFPRVGFLHHMHSYTSARERVFNSIHGRRLLSAIVFITRSFIRANNPQSYFGV